MAHFGALWRTRRVLKRYGCTGSARPYLLSPQIPAGIIARALDYVLLCYGDCVSRIDRASPVGMVRVRYVVPVRACRCRAAAGVSGRRAADRRVSRSAAGAVASGSAPHSPHSGAPAGSRHPVMHLAPARQGRSGQRAGGGCYKPLPVDSGSFQDRVWGTSSKADGTTEISA